MQHDQEQQYRKEFYRYAGGLMVAFGLTYAIYMAATEQWFERVALAGFLLTAASLQLIVQLVVFLHVGRKENGPRWTLLSIIYTVLMLAIIVGGSLWIMANMNYNMHMSPEQMQEFMLEQNKKGF